jgi:hypothetical protein
MGSCEVADKCAFPIKIHPTQIICTKRTLAPGTAEHLHCLYAIYTSMTLQIQTVITTKNNIIVIPSFEKKNRNSNVLNDTG